MGPHCIDGQNCHLLLTLIVHITLMIVHITLMIVRITLIIVHITLTMMPILLYFSKCVRLVPLYVVVFGDFISCARHLI